MVDPVQQTRLAALLQSFEGTPALPAAADAKTSSAAALRPGSTVLALVTAVLPDGRSVIDVEGALFQTRVPGAPPAAGERLRLVVLQAGERPTFSMAAPAGTAAPAGARVELSTLAAQLRTVAEVSAKAASGTKVPVSTPPVIPEPSTAPVTWTEPLRQAIEHSGMFYESHQAQWVAGQRPQAALAVEPQAAFAAQRAGADAASASATDHPVTTDTLRPASAEVTAPGAASATPASSADASLIPPALATLVDRQLQTLASHQIQWTGTVWPGQTMQWQVEEDRTARDAPEETPRWTSRLRLTLPRLGEFDARVDLRGGQIQLRLAVDPSAQAEVKRSLPALQAALRERGLEIVGLAVGAHDDA